MDNLALELERGAAEGRVRPTVATVRASCAAAAARADAPARIDEARARRLGVELDAIAEHAPGHLMAIDVAFDDVDAEANFVVALHLFNFGHAYRHPLHDHQGRGAWQTMLRGVQRMHLDAAGGRINRDQLAQTTAMDVRRWFGLPVGVPVLAPLVDMIVRVAQATARDLDAAGFADFAAFVRAHQSHAGPPCASTLVESLAAAFAALDDRRRLADGTEVLLLKKAQIAVGELWRRLASRAPQRFAFPDVGALTVVCDNVLPCVLRALGVLRFDAGLGEAIDARVPLPAGPTEASLRAVAVAAAEIVLDAADGAVTSKQLSDWLWTLGKDPRYRPLERHATPDTCFY